MRLKPILYSFFGIFTIIATFLGPLDAFGLRVPHLGLRGYMALFLVSLFMAVGIESYRYYIKMGISLRQKAVKRIIEGVRWLLSSSSYWGRHYTSSFPRVANAAEGIMALSSASAILPESIRHPSMQAVEEAINFLLGHAHTEGLPSITLHRSTVHATAMGLYALITATQKFTLELPDDVNEKQEELVQALLLSRSSWGWGFLNQREDKREFVRIFSTLWALRALSVAGAFDNECEEILWNLTRFSRGEIGFFVGDSFKVATASLFLILLAELPNHILRERLLGFVGQEQFLRRVASSVLKQNVFVEIEEFPLSPSQSQILQGVEKLSWAHVSAALALQGLSVTLRWRKERYLEKEVKELVKLLMRQFPRTDFRLTQIPQKRNNPLVFPAAYFIMGMSEWLNVVTYYKRKEAF